MSVPKDYNRIAINLFQNNPEHMKVYEILQKQSNKNAFIRDAILYYDHGYQKEVVTKADIQQMIEATMDKKLDEFLEKLEKAQQKPLDLNGFQNIF